MTKSKSWLDKLPADVRHGLVLIGGAVLAWLGTITTTLPQPLPEIAAVILAVLALRYTKITKQYGVGKDS